MWLFPGEEDNTVTTQNALHAEPSMVASTQQLKSQASQTPPQTTNLPRFESEYPKETVLTVPVFDDEWPVKDPVLDLVHCYGYDTKRKDNLHVLSDTTVAYVAGGIGVVYDLYAKVQQFLYPTAGNVIRHLAVHPAKAFIAAAERGPVAGVNIFEYPTLRLVARLRCDGDKDIVAVHFNREGSHILTVSPAPTYLLTVWDWENETALVRSRASTTYPIVRAKFSSFHTGVVTSAGIDHIKFWYYQSTDSGWQIHCTSGKYGSRATATIECFVVLALGSVITASTDGTVCKWIDGEIQCEVLRKTDEEKLHDGVITNMLTHGRSLLTMGTDGFIKLWSWDQLEGPSDTENVLLDVVTELSLGPGCIPLQMVHFPGEQETDHSVNCWLVLDEKGMVWKVDHFQAGDKPSVPTELLYTHGGPIRAVAYGHSDHYFATTGEAGNIRVFSSDRKVCIAYAPWEENPATALVWIHPKVAPDRQILAAGYADGCVKLLEMTEMWNVESGDLDFFLPKSAPKLTCLDSRRIQRGEIVQLALNDNTGILASVSTKGDTVMLLYLKPPETAPIALYKIKSPTYFCWKRTGTECTMYGLITADEARTYEVLLPHEVQEESLNVMMEDRNDEDPDFYSKNLVPITQCPFRSCDFKSIKASLQNSPETEAPYMPSKIVWAMYDPLDSGKFWFSASDFDAGYLYCCEFGTEGPVEPIQALKVDPVADVTVHGALFLDNGHLLVISTSEGSVQIFLLHERYVVQSRVSTWKFKVHDGIIDGICCGKDAKELVTVGSDWNILSFRLDVPDTETVIMDRRFFKEVWGMFQTTDLSPSEAVELDQFLKADRNFRDAAERSKEASMEEIIQLKKELRGIMAENEQLPPELQLKEEEFTVHLDVRAAIEGDFARRLRDAKNQDIVERVKGRIVLERLLEYFRGDLETAPEIKLVSFDEQTTVSTYWVQKVEEDLDQKISVLQKKTEARKESLNCAVDPVACRLKENFYLESLTSFELTGTEKNPEDLSVEKKNWERIKYEEYQERAKRRRQEWRLLLNRKPNVTEENAEFLASEKKRVSGQEYKIKQNADHAIQFMAEYLTASEIKLKMMLLRKQVHGHKTEFNDRVCDLRDEKLYCIGSLKDYDRDLEKIQKKIPGEKRRSLPPVPDLEAEESAQHSLRPTREECMKIYAQRREAEARKRKREMAERNAESGETGEDADGNAASSGNKPRFARLQSFTTRQIRLSLQAEAAAQELDESPWDDLHYEISEEEKREQEQGLSLLLYQQDKIVESAKSAKEIFDGKLGLLRHDKFALDIELKRAEMHLIIHQWEYRILNEYEDRERELVKEEAKLRERHTATERRLRMIEPDLNLLQTKLKMYRDREDRIKTEFEAQLRTVINQRRFRVLLTNIFNHGIKGRSASTGQSDDDVGQTCVFKADESEESNPTKCSASLMSVMELNRSTMLRSSLKWRRRSLLRSRLTATKSKSSLVDFNPTEIYVCPKDLDKKVFQAVHNLNRQYQRVRKDIEDEIDRNREIMGVSLEAKEELGFIEFLLADVSGNLHELRKEKFSRWKDIPFPVVVRMDQIQFPTERVLRSDLYDAVVFDESNLEKLSSFVEQLRQETTTDKEALSKLKEEYAKLEREQIIFALRIEQLKQECRTTMIEKFGGIIDLDQADSLRVDPQMQELRDQLAANQRKQDEAVAALRKEADKIQKDLTKTRADTTKHLQTIAGQMAERDVLVNRTSKRADKIGRGVLESATTEDLRHHQEKYAMWQIMAETQQAEIDALATEISFFKRKDTDVNLLKEMIARRYKEGVADAVIQTEMGLGDSRSTPAVKDARSDQIIRDPGEELNG